MNKIYEIFKDYIKYPSDYTSCYWVKEDNELHLFSERAEFERRDWYDSESYEVIGRGVKKDGYIIFNVDDWCGSSFYIILTVKNKIK